MNNLNSTGYPSIDRPWMKYYSSQNIDIELPSKTIFQYMKEKSAVCFNKTAITYYGRKITYQEFYNNIEMALRVFLYLDVQEDDRILFLMPNIPETAYTFYGCTEIGAIADYMDPRPDNIDLKVSANKILSMIQREKISHIVALDQCYLGLIVPIEGELCNDGIIKNIIIVSAADSMDKKAQRKYLTEAIELNGIREALSKVKKINKISNLVKYAVKQSRIPTFYYQELLQACDITLQGNCEYKRDKIAAIVHSSGTTSTTPKAIPLTHDNFNAYIQQSFVSNMPMKYEDSALHILPYFAAYGLVNVVHSGFCHGNNLIQIPEFVPAQLGKLISKYQPNTIIGTPTWFLQIIKDKSLKKKDLSFLTMICYGGDSMEENDERTVNEFLKAHNCREILTKGHGMSEASGCSSFANNEYNEPGTMGIPLYNTVYALVDPETKEMVRFSPDSEYIEGEMIISSPTVTLGELDGVTYAEHRIYDGMDYILTRDIARMDRNGVLTFLSRSDRSFTRYDGYKIKPFELENLIKSYPGVKYCVISSYFDNVHMGNMPVVNLVLNNEKNLENYEALPFVKELVNKIFLNNPEISSRQIPSLVRIRKALPISQNGKIDFKAMENEAFDGTEIHIDIEETNISIGSIKIY